MRVPDRDDDLLALLRDVAATADPVPPSVAQEAQIAWDLHRLDTELLELTHDSLAEPAPAGVRSTPSGRALSFELDDLAVELEVSGAGPERELEGLVVPPPTGTVQLRAREGTLDVDVDAGGAFRLAGVRPGPVSLSFRMPDGRWAATSWTVI